MRNDVSTQAGRESARSLQLDDRVGSLIHVVLASLLRSSEAISVESARKTTDAQLPEGLAPVYRQALRQRVIASCLIYDSDFRRVDWRYAGAEQILEDSALDLVWIDSSGAVYADEVKAGLATSLHIYQLTAQCRAQYAAGVSVFGRRFAGVRAVLLGERREGMLGARTRGEIEWRP